MKKILLLILVIICISCATEKQVRGYANDLSLNLEQLERNIDEFSKKRQALAKGRLQKILDVESTITEVDNDIALQMFVLEDLNEERREEHLKTILAASNMIQQNQKELSALKAEHKKLVDGMGAQLDFQTSKIDDLQKTLLQYSTQAKLKDEINFYQSFFKAVGDDLKASLDSMSIDSSDSLTTQ